MADTYLRYPSSASSSLPTYANFAALPGTANDGAAAITLDSDSLYIFNSGSSTWILAGGTGVPLSVGNLDGQAANAKGAAIASNQFFMQSADATHPGLINITTQTFGGTKTFSNVNTSGVYQSGGSTLLSNPGTGNTFLGVSAGSGASSSFNTVSGLSAGSSSMSGGLNSLYGVNAGKNITSGTQNTCIGTNTGGGIFTGTNNACFGYSADIPNDSSNSFALGANAVANVSNAFIFGSSSVNCGVGNVNSSNPTARMHLPGGTTSAGSAPLKLTSGSLMTSAEAGAIENDGTDLYYTSNTPTRQKVCRTSGFTMSSTIDMGSNKITSVTDPTSAQDAATKNYVDNIAAGINPAVAVLAATTAAGNTSSFTYSNGASGVGATLTGVVNTALTVDGYTFTAVGQRLLVKNDTQSPSGAFNGIYSVTQVQTGVLPLILTRALDYNAPSDMNNTGAIPVINGTVNGTTQWVLTSSITTVGTDPLTFTKFARNPSDYLLAANNLSDVSTKSTAFNNLSPMTTGGDLIYGGASGAGTRLANGSANQVLQSAGGTSAPTWTTNIAGNAANVTGTVAIGNGGTGQVTKAAGFDALSPMTTGGDIIYGGSSGTGTRLANGSSGQFLTSGGGTAAPSWTSATAPNFSVTSAQTGTYAILTTDNVVIVNPSSSFTATLPTAVGVTGKQYLVKNVKDDVTKVVTLATTSSQTIDGSTTRKLSTLYECWTITSDGANWQVLGHKTITPWRNNLTFTFNQFGTTSNSNIWWRRVGDSIEVKGTITSGTPGSSTASITLPTGIAIDSTKYSATASIQTVGVMYNEQNTGVGANTFPVAGNVMVLFYDGSDTATIYMARQYVNSALTKQAGNDFSNASTNVMSVEFYCPVSGWDE